MPKHLAAIVSIVGLAGSAAAVETQARDGGKLTLSQQTLRQQGQLSAYNGQSGKDAQITKGKAKDDQITKGNAGDASITKGKAGDASITKGKAGDAAITKGKAGDAAITKGKAK